MTIKSKTTATGMATLFALSALSSQSLAGGPIVAVFDPGSNQGPPSCDGDRTPGEVLGGTAADRAKQEFTVQTSTVAGGPSTINGVVGRVLAAGPESAGECGLTPITLQED